MNTGFVNSVYKYVKSAHEQVIANAQISMNI